MQGQAKGSRKEVAMGVVRHSGIIVSNHNHDGLWSTSYSSGLILFPTLTVHWPHCRKRPEPVRSPRKNPSLRATPAAPLGHFCAETMGYDRK